MSTIVPVILCGGSGTRMWPLSRGGYPKQFLNLYGDESLLQQTAIRLSGFPHASSPIVVANAEQRFLVSEQLRSVGIFDAQVLLEPLGRNTAPAVAAAALRALEQDLDAVLMILPSDHIIKNNDEFQRIVQQAVHVAKQGYLVTFGIKPTQPLTGYGYIAKGQTISSSNNTFDVSAFVEKPTLDKAEEYLALGGYYWNSGMFMFKADAYLQALNVHQPKMVESVTKAYVDAVRDADFIRLNPEAFQASPSISIDYALMEKTDRAALVVADNLGWSDVGSWDALADISLKDENGNNVLGDVFLDGVQNSYIRSDNRMIAAIGVDNVVIVETADAILVARKDKVQSVKSIVERLNLQGRSESVTHRKVYRPWGSYESLDAGPRFQVKRIIVNPGSSLSLQMHYHRAEHWVVVRGTAKVMNGDKEILLTENQSTYIPIGTKHRLENPGKCSLELIEVQSGTYLGEDDILRFEDIYGRVTCVNQES